MGGQEAACQSSLIGGSWTSHREQLLLHFIVVVEV